MPKDPIETPPRHRKTCRRYEDVGHAYALTFSGFKHQPFLSRDQTREWMIQATDLARTEQGLDLWAFVIMPAHVHLLILPTSLDYWISAILSTLKQCVAKRAVLYVRRQLCGCPSNWPWSSASFYEGHSSGPLKIDVNSLPDDPRSL
ncbi:MAG: hypothetical protein IID37_06085 [Planctomycetes bacterium]|nr:hypothetical protein [Planctomycetota bacterium]